MFELEGEQYSLEQVTSAAEQSNMSLEDYLEEYGIKKLEEAVETVGKPKDVVEKDATVTSIKPEQASESMELEQVDTSLVSEDPEPKVRRGRAQVRQEELQRREVAKIKLSAEPKFDEFDAVEELKTSGSLFKANLKRVGANLAEIPAFVNRLKFSVGKAFLSDEDKEKINKLTPEEQDQVAQAFGGVSVPGTINIGALAEPGQKAAANLRSQAEKLEENLKVYDNTITDTIFKEGDVTEGVTRLVTQGIGTIPSIMQAMIPYVGIPSIVAGSAAEASREAVYEKGKDIDLKQQLYSAGIGASEGLLEIVTKKIGKSAFKGLIGKPKEVVKKTLLQTGTGIAKAGGAEGLSETGTLAINKFLESKYFNEKGLFDMDEKKWDEFWDEAGDTFLIGMTTGKSMAGAGATAVGVRDAIGNRSVRKELNKTNINEVSEAFTDDSVDNDVVNLARNNFSERVLDIELNKKVNLGNLTKEKANEIKDNFNNARAAVTLADNLNINDALINETVGLVQERNKVSKKIKQAGENKALVDTDIKRLAEIDNRLSEISAENQLSITTKAVTDIVSGLEGLTIEIAENQEQADQIAKDKNLEKKASIQQGFILQNPETGEQTIVINKEIAKKEKAVNVAAHELLHGVLFKTVKDSPETAVNLGKALLGEINKIDATQVKDSKFKRRLEQYSKAPESVKMEEAITLFSDALATGDIKFNENVFTKIGDQIRRIMQSLGVNVKFNTGRDVYNFVKDYNRSIEKGKIGKAQIKAAKKGVKGALVQEATTEAETIIKESRSEEASQEVQKIYEEQGVAGAFEILEKFKPITNKLVERRSQAPNFDRQLLTDEIETGKRGIFDLIREYKPDSGVPLAAYINKFLPARAIEASNRVLGEEFTDDVTEAKGVMAEETTTEVAEERVAKKIKPTSLIPTESVTKIKEQVTEKIKEIPTDKLTFKKLGDLAPEIIAEAIGIPVKKLVDPKANLSKGDANAIQRFVNKNADKLLKILPEGAVLEAATEKIIGTSTGVPKGLLNAFYTKQKRVGTAAGLAPFTKNANITKADFLKAFGIVEGKKAEDFSARSPEAQALKGMANLYGRLVTNEVARTETDLDIETKQDIAAGKSRVMFSKSSDVNEKLTTNNENYVKFRNSILNKDMFHGGSKASSNEATWFYLDDAEAAKMWGDGKVYKTNSSLLTDQLIIPDLNDVSEYHKHASKKFGLPEENFFDVRNIMKLPNAYEVINDWIDWVTKNETDWDLGYNLYEQGSLTEGIAVTVIGKIPESKLEPFKEDLGTSKARVMFSKNSALEEGIDPKTLLSTKTSKKTLSTKQVNKKSDIIFNDTKALFLNNIGDVNSFLDNAVVYLKNIKLKDKDLQNNIRRVATAPSTRGNLTEYYNWHKLDNNNTLKETLGIKKLIPKKWNSPNDIEAEFNDGTIEGIEVKMNWKDIMGSGGLFFDGEKVKSYTYNNGEPKVSDDIVDGINNNTEVINKLITATENTSDVKSIVKDGKVGMPFTLLSETEGQARSSRKELNRPKFKDISMSIDQVLNHYKKKDVGLFIVGDELFYVQDKRGNFKEMGIPKLNTDASIKLRVKTSGIKFRKTTKDFVDSYTLTGQYQFSKKPKNGLKFSKAQEKDLDKTFNDILEKKSGIPSRKRYGIVEAITKGSSKGKFNFFIPPSAEDFVGLLYPTLGKGKIGDAQMSWYKKNLIDPYAEGMNKLSKARVYITNTYNQLKKQLDIVPKNLTKKVGETDYTKEQAVRVYIWRKQKMEVPGMSKKDVNMLADYVASNDKLQSFADQLINLQLGDGYAKPKVGWPAGTITTDILEGLNTTKRAKYLSKWQQNVDAIFSEDNLNKLQAIYGVNYRKALEGTLERMKTGRNRNFAGDSMTGRFTDWLTGSIGTIMFFNTRSAILQTISAANYINFEDNNIFAAGKAFANQKQYWSDFMKLINSDFLKERRGGLRMNVNEADISDMAKKGGARGVISKLLELGFTPTQVADSFAIASGGSTFYRNRINTYKKQGLSDKEAEKKAFEDFRETTEESQQSSRADRISQQQASPLGRIVLAFANAPAQYARIIKKAASDLKNGRGNPKANISRIIYYGAVQNLIFNALQQALFATAFGDDEPEDEEKEKKYISIANGMLDSILRGSGIGGAIVSVGKNTLLKLVRELEKDRPKLQNVASELLKISPAVSAKYSRLVQAGKSYDWNKEEMREKGLSLDNPAFLAAGNVVSALTNIPLDRAVKKANNVVQATTQDLQTWERIGLLGGWQDWELGIKEDKKTKDVGPVKTTRKRVVRKKVKK